MEWNSTEPRSRIRNRIIENNLLPQQCSKCFITHWLGEKITLHLDHINGINNDNRLDNLRFLCPNCHSLTDTFAGKNNKVKYSKINKKVSDLELLEALQNNKDTKSALMSVGLAGAGNYKRVNKLAEKYNLEAHYSMEAKNLIKKNKLIEANIDITKYGWVGKASSILQINSQKTRQWINRYYPEFLEEAFTRNS